MKRATAVSFVVFLAMAAIAAADPPVTVLDQVQAVIDDSVGGLAVGGSSDQRLTQTVTVVRTR